MSLRRKNLIAIISTLIGLLLVLSIVSQFIILRQFDEQQKQTIQADVGRAVNALTQQLDNLASVSSDWAYWDATYQFVLDGNQDYIDANLYDDSVTNLHLDFMLYVNSQGKSFYLKLVDHSDQAFDVDTGTLKIQPADMKTLLSMSTPKQLNQGIIFVGPHPAVVASRHILNSGMAGTPHGVLIIGRYLNPALLDQISQQTQLKVSITPWGSAQTATDFAGAKTALAMPTNDSFFYWQANHMAYGYTVLNDINNQPLLILEVQTLNNIYQAGQQAVLYILLMLLMVGLVFGFVIIWLVERIVISRLAYMDHRISEISHSNDLSARIAMHGDDELTRLAATINNSLAKQEQSQEEQFRTLNAELTRVNNELQEKIADLKANQKYKDRFFSHASHELRTPLAIMRNRLYLARKKPDLWESHIDELEDTLGRLLNVIDDIFDMTKLQDHNLTLNLQRIDLKNFMPMILDSVTPRMKDKGTHLCLEFAADDMRVNIDFTYFGRACEKLLIFMLDFCEPNHDIVFRLQEQNGADRPHAYIELSSTGMHFKDAEIPQLFTPFNQVSEGDILNSGLNLAIAKQIVLLHEGTLEASADAIKGGCFQIIMPIVANPIN
jgi:sensor domain CHASE-containing protein